MSPQSREGERQEVSCIDVPGWTLSETPVTGAMGIQRREVLLGVKKASKRERCLNRNLGGGHDREGHLGPDLSSIRATLGECLEG
jgi:hypothetical protein